MTTKKPIIGICASLDKKKAQCPCGNCGNKNYINTRGYSRHGRFSKRSLQIFSRIL